MSDPLFPGATGIFKANITFRDFHAGEMLQPEADITVRTAPLNHPGRATGYRVEFGGRAVAYITDTEHRPGKPDEHVRALDRGVGLTIYDCNFTDDKYKTRFGC